MNYLQSINELEELQIPNITCPQNLIPSRSRSSDLLPTINSFPMIDSGSAAADAAGGEIGHKGSSNEDKNNKKSLHRDIERQRRKEMATLYASLRSVLPLQYIKGKRSISDHMHEAVNYIKHLQKRINHLQELAAEITGTINVKNNLDCYFNVSPCKDGVEILIRSRQILDTVFPLSKVIKRLQEDGIHVVSSVSTRVIDTTFYTIISQADDQESCIDIMGLQKKLEDVLSQNSTI